MDRNDNQEQPQQKSVWDYANSGINSYRKARKIIDISKSQSVFSPPKIDPRILNRSSGIYGRINNFAPQIGKMASRFGFGGSSASAGGTAIGAEGAAAAGATAGAPVLVIAGIIILLILLAVFIIYLFIYLSDNPDDGYNYGVTPPQQGTPIDGTPPANPIPGLSLEKSAGGSVNNGEEITYTITAIYGGNLDVTIWDNIPKNTQYLSASGEKNVDNAAGTISWRLGANTPTRSNEAEGKDIYTFTLTVKPTADNIMVENQAYATAPGGTTGPAPETNDFEKLMEGQGRNTQVLGDETSFVEKALSNISRRLPGGRSVYESYLHDIYKMSTSHNVNPAIVLTIWGVEQSFAINGREFGCKPFDTGFAMQVDCSATTLDTWMTKFDETKASGTFPVPLTFDQTCNYTDPFIYAYEAYTPVCTMYDSNDESRTNFVIIYKEILYGVQ